MRPPILEMGLWVRDGATPWQAIQAATKNAAELCEVGDELGTVEAGKLADLIVVADNPLDDITNIRKLMLVVKEGQVVSDKRTPDCFRQLSPPEMSGNSGQEPLPHSRNKLRTQCSRPPPSSGRASGEMLVRIHM